VPLQVSVVHALPSSAQAVPLGFFASAGQVALLPGQVSAMSQPPTASARQTVDVGAKPLAGHAVDEPLHVSATSQPPGAAARHTVPFDSGLHVPTCPGCVQLPQPLLHAVLQQTPLTQ
jgi:hypothetical protein